MKVSVVIPIYNQEKLVIRAFDSVPKRDDVEIIAIDDGSTDNTLKSIQDYMIKNKQTNFIRCLINDKNRGVAYTVNRGYDYARGEYVVLLGSDDYFITDKFNEFIDNELTGEDLIYFNLQINNGDVWKVDKETSRHLVGSVKFMKRSFIGDTRNPEDVRFAEDLYFFHDLIKKNPSEKFTDKTIKHYNHPRENSLTWLRARGL